MKVARILLTSAAVLLVLMLLVVAVALVPAVQRSLVKRALRDVPGLKFDVARVSAGLSGLKAEEVRVEKNRASVIVKHVEADFSLWSLLWDRTLAITRLAASGVEIDASRQPAAAARIAAAGAPASTPGLLARVQLPFDLLLDDVSIAGRAVLPGASPATPLASEFTVTGGKFAPGQEGALQMTAVVHDPSPAATVSTLRLQSALRATLTPQRNFSKAALTLVADAEGPALSNASQLKVGVSLFRSSAGENYDIAVDTRMHGETENVLRLQVQLPSGSHRYAGNWQLNARTAQIAPFALGRPLPEFAASGEGKFAVDPVGRGYVLQGSLRGQIEALERVNPAWREFGRIKLDAGFDVAQQDGIATVRDLKVAIADGSPVLEAHTSAPVAFDLGKQQLVTAQGVAPGALQLKLLAVPLAWLRPFAGDLAISGAPFAGELEIGSVAGAPTAAAIRGELRATDLTIARGDETFVRHASIQLRTEAALSDQIVSAPVLEFLIQTTEGDALRVNGRLSAPLGDHPELSVTGSFAASSEKRFTRWLPNAPVVAQGDLSVGWTGDRVDVQPGRIQVQHAGKSLFGLTVLQAFAVNLGSHAITSKDPEAPLARVELGKIPLALLPLTEPDTTLGGSVEKGDFEVVVTAGRTVVRSVGGLRLADVSLAQGKRVALRGLAVELTPRVEYAGPENFRFESGELAVRAQGRPMFSSTNELVAAPGQPLQFTSTFALEVPALATQPVFADAEAVSAGRATGEIRGKLDERRQVEARLTVNGLVTAETGRILPVANIGLRWITEQDGAISLQAPILLDNGGRRSDLELALQLKPKDTGYAVEGDVTGQQVELEDAQGLLAVFLAAAAPENADRPANSTSGAVAPDTVAAWSKFAGRLGLNVKSVTRGKDWAMTGLTGQVLVEPARLELTKLTAAFSETSQLAAKMEMRFDGGPMPYRVTGSYALNDFDVGKLFRAFDPGRAPTVEGLFTINSQLAGNGETPSRALERVHGGFQLTSREGTFRGLQRVSGKVSVASKAVELGASVLGSLFGSEKATKTAEKVAGQAYFVDQLAQSLGELKFDLLSVNLVRDDLLNMNLEDFTLMSEELRLNGRGEITYVAEKPLLDQPLAATVELAARGKIEEQLGKLRLLNGTKDDLGYARAREPVAVGGSLARPDPSSFFTKLASAKLSEFLDQGN